MNFQLTVVVQKSKMGGGSWNSMHDESHICKKIDQTKVPIQLVQQKTILEVLFPKIG